MTKEKMSIHKGLRELKLLNDRIEKAIGSTLFIGTVIRSNQKINGVPIDDLTKEVKAEYASIKDLLNRRAAIKRAITLSNASTMVTVGDITATVAELIEMKNNTMELEKDLLDKMNSQYRAAVSKLNNHNELVIEKANRYIEQMYGNKENINPEATAKDRETYTNIHSADLFDPLNLKQEIDERSNRLEDFNSNIDAALSESNAITIIEIEY